MQQTTDHLQIAGTRRRRLALTVAVSILLLLLQACSSPSQAPQSTVLTADEGFLCLVGRDLVRIPERLCLARQAVERDEQSTVSELLNRGTVAYSPGELGLDLLEAIALGARYRYAVEPSYRDEYFTRIDRYMIRASVNPGDLLAGLPLRIALSRDRELMFAQQFVSAKTARSPQSAYLPEHLPISAERALALKAGDFVRFSADLGLLAQAGQMWPLAGFLLASKTGISVLLDGEYEISVFRLDGSRVRIRLMAQRARALAARATVNPGPWVRAAILDRADRRLVEVESIVSMDAEIALAASRERSELFLVDYTLDLRQRRARQAYDAVFSPAIQLSDVRISSPLQGKFELRDRLIGSIAAMDELARQSLGAKSPAVKRHFMGSNYALTRTAGFSLRLSSYAASRERIFRENFLTRSTLTAEGTREEYYLLPTWSKAGGRSSLFGMLNERQRRNADALIRADALGNPVEFMNVGFALDYQDARLRPSEYRRFRRRIELLLPDAAEQELAALLADTRWLEDVYRPNVHLQLDYFFRKGAFDALVAGGFGSEDRLRQALAEFILEAIGAGEFVLFTGSVEDLPGLRRGAGSSRQELLNAVSEHWAADIGRAARALSTAFTAGNDGLVRTEAILGLRNQRFYQSVGTAFWVYLVDQADIDVSSVFFLNMRLLADGHQGVEYSFGDPGDRALYESVRLIQRTLNERGLDMREEGTLDTVISRMTIVDAE